MVKVPFINTGKMSHSTLITDINSKCKKLEMFKDVGFYSNNELFDFKSDKMILKTCELRFLLICFGSISTNYLLPLCQHVCIKLWEYWYIGEHEENQKVIKIKRHIKCIR